MSVTGQEIGASRTPGPWSVDTNTGLDVRGPDGKDVCVALCQEMGGLLFDSKSIGPERRQQAFDNALLIAAAPDLLAAATRLRAALNDHVSLADVDALDAAIAKAVGK